MGAGLNLRRGPKTVLVLLALALARSAAAQAAGPREREYWDVVAQYAKGDPGGALVKIGLWTEKGLDTVAGSVEGLARSASKCRDCEARQRFDALPLRAAILLHAQRDRADRILRIKERDGEPDCSARSHGLMSERLVKSVASQTGGRDFVARFSVAMAMDLRAMLCFVGATRWTEFGLKTAPDDAVLLVAQGLAAETIGVTGYTEGGASSISTILFSSGRQISSSEPPKVDKTRRLNEARLAFEKALAIDPDQEEARLRLGRVLWRLGRNREAQLWLRKAVGGKESSIVYLGHLFLGQCLEEDQDGNGAIAEYKAALSLRPDSQIGAVALAASLSLRGDPETARDVLERVLPFAGRRKEVDPYWLYLIGAPDLGATLLDALRRESSR